MSGCSDDFCAQLSTCARVPSVCTLSATPPLILQCMSQDGFRKTRACCAPVCVCGSRPASRRTPCVRRHAPGAGCHQRPTCRTAPHLPSASAARHAASAGQGRRGLCPRGRPCPGRPGCCWHLQAWRQAWTSGTAGEKVHPSLAMSGLQAPHLLGAVAGAAA